MRVESLIWRVPEPPLPVKDVLIKGQGFKGYFLHIFFNNLIISDVFSCNSNLEFLFTVAIFSKILESLLIYLLRF